MSRSWTRPGLPVAAGSRGEIAVRGIGLMAGYLDNPEATVATMRGESLATGDVGWIGEDGNLRIVDRLKDMVVVGGFNVYPAEVERAPRARRRARPRSSDCPMPAWVRCRARSFVPAPGAAIDVETLVDFLGARLAKFKVPRTVWVVDRLPIDTRRARWPRRSCDAKTPPPAWPPSDPRTAAPRSRTLDAPCRVDPLRLALLGERLGAFLLVGVAPQRPALGPGLQASVKPSSRAPHRARLVAAMAAGEFLAIFSASSWAASRSFSGGSTIWLIMPSS